MAIYSDIVYNYINENIYKIKYKNKSLSNLKIHKKEIKERFYGT